ncbi:hypothetical protein HOI26_02620 [Candidatus Woesearchaeota archaeon]|jgi:hypothetical protein|nr:hypothetical protein [Candidatus Woesearchaeota archaeon]MBT5739971.1 hypothetical protein [Candidatus Woesearchaeota archaeon]
MAAVDTLSSFITNFGILEFLLPFLLVFTIIYAVAEKSKILGEKKAYNVVLAVIFGLLFVLPHQLGIYPLGYDPVAVLNASLPSIALVAVAAIMILLLMGVFGANFTTKIAPWIALASLGFVIYIFGSALGFWISPSTQLSWWTTELTELLIIILVFGGIVWLITKEPNNDPGPIKKFGDYLQSMVEKP